MIVHSTVIVMNMKVCVKVMTTLLFAVIEAAVTVMMMIIVMVMVKQIIKLMQLLTIYKIATLYLKPASLVNAMQVLWKDKKLSSTMVECTLLMFLRQFNKLHLTKQTIEPNKRTRLDNLTIVKNKIVV